MFQCYEPKDISIFQNETEISKVWEMSFILARVKLGNVTDSNAVRIWPTAMVLHQKFHVLKIRPDITVRENGNLFEMSSITHF